MSIDEVKAKLNALLTTYPNDFRIISSSDDIDKNKIDVLNSEIHGPFNNDDLRLIEVLEKSLSAGKQAFVLPVGSDRILVQTAISGKLFDIPRSSRNEAVNHSRGENLLEKATRSVSTNGVGVLVAAVIFILSIVIAAISGRGAVDYCCVPIIFAVVAYFVTPVVMRFINKENDLNSANIGRDISAFFKSLLGHEGAPENNLRIFHESERDIEEQKFTLSRDNDIQADKFSARMPKILTIVKARGMGIKDFQTEEENSFAIETGYDAHRTWLKYKPTEDEEIIRMELTHVFGYIDSDDIDSQQLLKLFSHNIPSFGHSSAYLGIKQVNGTFYTSLNAAPIFSAKMRDEDIAEALWLNFFDILNSLILQPPSPIKILE